MNHLNVNLSSQISHSVNYDIGKRHCHPLL